MASAAASGDQAAAARSAKLTARAAQTRARVASRWPRSIARPHQGLTAAPTSPAAALARPKA
ncbi:hypothetical protein ACFQY5_19915 [Paeniroseomonas aquatica]|uniref:hypothetical protein n=1 Tax=Paeniroseomonas aquatica TaxID=373043 RepID=UPI003619B455